MDAATVVPAATTSSDSRSADRLRVRIARASLRAAAGLLVTFAALSACRDAGATARPNVLLVIIDTARADRCSQYGYPRPTTPSMEALARDAVTFDDAWSQASWTVPAHAALFTGMDPHRLDVFRGPDVKLRDSRTVAEILGDDGWETAAFSGNPWVAPDTGLTRGFTTFWQVLRNQGETAAADEVTDAALTWIREHRNEARPFFAFLNLMEPHAPYDPPTTQSARFLRPDLPPDVVTAARRLNAPGGLLESSVSGVPLPAPVDAALSDLYDAEIATADAQLGRLLDDLRSDGTLDRTLVVVASDHGEGLGDHGWREHGARLHRELLRVPLVVRLPGRFDGGRRVADLVRLMDVAPTILAACGLEPPGTIDGRDLAGAIDAPAPRPPVPSFARWPFYDLSRGTNPKDRPILELRRHSVYDGRFHMLIDANGGAELYDVRSDPGENVNLATSNPAEAERLRDLLRAEFRLP